MRIFMVKGRVTKKKKSPPLHGGAVKANQMFAERGKAALHSMLKPKNRNNAIFHLIKKIYY